MEIVTGVSELRHLRDGWRQAGAPVALVPTMGNLHAGHLALVAEACRRASRVVVSIFVNPAQFGPEEDFQAYPRTFDEDTRQLTQYPVDVLFHPAPTEVYPDGWEHHAQVSVPGLSEILCGAFRPGHFTGVATVVTKLFNLVQPDVAVFGEKDYQQWVVVRRLTQDLCLPVEVVGVATVREPDGLARSSRNRYLDPAQRQRAPVLYQILRRQAEVLRRGSRDFRAVEQAGLEALRTAGLRPEYLSVRRAGDLAVPQAADSELVILAAAWLGRTRLIDNLRLRLALNPAG
ncbi:MAG: pantoate--beta-alanine ligase [Chromatiales bacterium 21-64-14]|nr:MAG: pantoate--beta-alanine ligase [Chromatiales bacterium 21-64-14]HQU14757.1 pantoate--beta-alanine ligase [Gammaproteobacteria bacterium]